MEFQKTQVCYILLQWVNKMKVIIYKTENNGVAIVHPSPNYENSLEELVDTVVPEGSTWKIVDISEIPSDRTFRNAWEWEDLT